MRWVSRQDEAYLFTLTSKGPCGFNTGTFECRKNLKTQSIFSVETQKQKEIPARSLHTKVSESCFFRYLGFILYTTLISCHTCLFRSLKLSLALAM